MRDKLNKIMKHFGMENQLDKLVEECTEFLDSGQEEEIADIYNVVVQIHNNSAIIQKIAAEKQDRTIQRIRSGYYDVS